MGYCRKCGQQNPAGAVYCLRCGEKLLLPQDMPPKEDAIPSAFISSLPEDAPVDEPRGGAQFAREDAIPPAFASSVPEDAPVGEPRDAARFADVSVLICGALQVLHWVLQQTVYKKYCLPEQHGYFLYWLLTSGVPLILYFIFFFITRERYLAYTRGWDERKRRANQALVIVPLSLLYVYLFDAVNAVCYFLKFCFPDLFSDGTYTALMYSLRVAAVLACAVFSKQICGMLLQQAAASRAPEDRGMPVKKAGGAAWFTAAAILASFLLTAFFVVSLDLIVRSNDNVKEWTYTTTGRIFTEHFAVNALLLLLNILLYLFGRLFYTVAVKKRGPALRAGKNALVFLPLFLTALFNILTSPLIEYLENALSSSTAFIPVYSVAFPVLLIASVPLTAHLLKAADGAQTV